MFDFIEKAERSTVEVDEEDWHLNTEEIDVNQASSELYDILCTVVNNGSEAMSVIRAVEDYQGLKAWQRLHLKYNPRTMARAIKLLGEVANPTPAKNVGEVEATLNKWESKMTHS